MADKGHLKHCLEKLLENGVKTMKWITQAATFCALAVPAAAIAGSATGTVTSLYESEEFGQIMYIEISGVKTANPACSTRVPWQFAMPASSQFYLDLYALISGAVKSGKTITVTGTGSCTVDSSMETIAGVQSP